MSLLALLAAPALLLSAAAPYALPPGSSSPVAAAPDPAACPAGQVRYWYGDESRCILPDKLVAAAQCRTAAGGDPGTACPYTRWQLRMEANRARRVVEPLPASGPGSLDCFGRSDGPCANRTTSALAPAPADTEGSALVPRGCTRRQRTTQGGGEWTVTCGDPATGAETEKLVRRMLNRAP
jgi:hypothetical protein